MESGYDENLNENGFYQELQREHFELFHKATIEGWVICVPRSGSMPNCTFTESDFFSHILVPNDELPETHFTTLNEKDVCINNRVIIVEPNSISTPYTTHILFEETFYTEDLLKYKVICIEKPLEQYSDSKPQSGVIKIQSLQDCIDLLWTESSKDVLEGMDEHIRTFLTTNDELEFQPLQIQKDLVGELYTKCLQSALKHPRLKGKIDLDRYLLGNVKTSVESYVLHGIYKKLIKGITACTAVEDANFNKTVRNLSDLQFRDLDIKSEFLAAVPKARSEITKVECYSTVLGKVGCLSKTVAAISGAGSNGNIALAADDLLPMLVFLVVKSNLANWIAHLTFMKEFSFSSGLLNDQNNFLVTSLEAAIEHIKSGLLVGPQEPESQMAEDIDTNDVSISSIKDDVEDSSLANLFELVKIGSVDQVRAILSGTNKVGSWDSGMNLCHPLCSCDKCEKELSTGMSSLGPTVNSCDDRGFTVLHVAAMYGRPKIVDMLLSMGADPNKGDCRGSTPLHLAAARGHQNALLLLAHGSARLNETDNDGNTPLHCAVSNGHEACVKAILYYAEHTAMNLNVNCTNNQGETALHSAARWGYENIVNILLEYGADPSIQNKRKLSVIDYAHNVHISKLLSKNSRSKSLDIPAVHKHLNNVTVAAATKMNLDFSEDDARAGCSKITSNVFRPRSTDDIKKVDRLLRAIVHGDMRLACFYMGIEMESCPCPEHPGACHPLCPSRSKVCTENGEELLSVNVCDAEGFTPLHMAAKCGQVELVKLLVSAGANVNVQTRSTRYSPLHMACDYHREEIARIILQVPNCLVNTTDFRGNSPLHLAARSGNAKIVQMLLNRKSKVNLTNMDGKTPIDIAQELMALTVVNVLSNVVTN